MLRWFGSRGGSGNLFCCNGLAAFELPSADVVRSVERETVPKAQIMCSGIRVREWRVSRAIVVLFESGRKLCI